MMRAQHLPGTERGPKGESHVAPRHGCHCHHHHHHGSPVDLVSHCDRGQTHPMFVPAAGYSGLRQAWGQRKRPTLMSRDTQMHKELCKRCHQMLLFMRLSPYRTSMVGNRGLQRERRACPGPCVLGGPRVCLKVQWAGGDILVFPASSCPREKPAQEAVGSPSCPHVALTLLWRKPSLRDM